MPANSARRNHDKRFEKDSKTENPLTSDFMTIQQPSLHFVSEVLLLTMLHFPIIIHTRQIETFMFRSWHDKKILKVPGKTYLYSTINQNGIFAMPTYLLAAQ